MKYTHRQIQSIITLADFHIHESVRDQIIKTIEELSSLNKMLCKLLLDEINYDEHELLDELFDVDVMIMSMKRLLIRDEHTEIVFNNIVDVKIERELKRWGLND